MGIIERDAEGFGFAYDFAGHEHVDLAGAPCGGAFSAALVQVQVVGVDAEAVEEVALELLVVARLGRRPVSAFHCSMWASHRSLNSVRLWRVVARSKAVVGAVTAKHISPHAACPPRQAL